MRASSKLSYFSCALPPVCAAFTVAFSFSVCGPLGNLPYRLVSRYCLARTTLSSHMEPILSSPTTQDLPTFLKKGRAALLLCNEKKARVKVVLGNEAADADSIVSSICLAQFLQMTRSSTDKLGSVHYVPILPLRRTELKLRPETLLLFRLAGILEALRDTVCIDEVDLLGAHAKDALTGLVLVDHNKLTASLQNLGPVVERIVDHHEDQGLYEKVTGGNRDIAFAADAEGFDALYSSAQQKQSGISRVPSLSSNSSTAGGRALVASTCTLVAERYLSNPDLLCPAVAMLLLGVVLLDSVCLDASAGKVTSRDEAVAKALAAGLAGRSDREWKSEQALYRDLSGAKFDQGWWQSLEVNEALGLDYKSFAASLQTRQALRFGMSSVLVALHDLLCKVSGVESVLERFASSRGVELLVLMSLVMPAGGAKDGGIQRTLAVYASCPVLARTLATLLLTPETEAGDLLLELWPRPEWGDRERCNEGGDREQRLWCFKQGNVQASRKQVEPILRRLLEDNEGILFPK